MTNQITTPEQLAKAIIDNPNLWGMYTIADAIHQLINQIGKPEPIRDNMNEILS